MKTPLRISMACIALNIPLSIALMFPLKQGGIALATVIAQMCNNMLLLYFLRRENLRPKWGEIALTMARSLIFSLIGVLPVFWYESVKNHLFNDWLAVIACAMFFGFFYLAGQLMAGAPEPGEFIGSLRSRKAGKKEK